MANMTKCEEKMTRVFNSLNYTTEVEIMLKRPVRKEELFEVKAKPEIEVEAETEWLKAEEELEIQGSRNYIPAESCCKVEFSTIKGYYNYSENGIKDCVEKENWYISKEQFKENLENFIKDGYTFCDAEEYERIFEKWENYFSHREGFYEFFLPVYKMKKENEARMRENAEFTAQNNEKYKFTVSPDFKINSEQANNLEEYSKEHILPKSEFAKALVLKTMYSGTISREEFFANNAFLAKSKCIFSGKSDIFKNWSENSSITVDDFIENLEWVCDDTLDEKGRMTREVALTPTGIKKLKRVYDSHGICSNIDESGKLWEGENFPFTVTTEEEKRKYGTAPIMNYRKICITCKDKI